MKPPIAARVPFARTVHDTKLEDPYHWLKDPAYPAVGDARVLQYLEAENAYFDYRMAPHRGLVDKLYAEIRSRQPEEEQSVPFRDHGYLYRWRFDAGAQYRVWERSPLSERPPAGRKGWQVILDEVALAADAPYFALGGFSVSPNSRYLAWSADSDGSERFVLYVRDIETGEIIGAPIGNCLGAPVWAADSDHFFYLQLNENWRPYQVRAHRLGEQPEQDRVVYEETDEAFFVGVHDTQSEAFIQITSGDHVTSEVRLLPADEPDTEPVLVSPRRAGHEYDLDHREGTFYIRSNDRHRNFRLATAPEATPGPENWQTLVAGSDDHYLTGHVCFRHQVVITERVGGLDQIRVLTVDAAGNHAEHYIEFPEAAYSVGLGSNAEYDPAALRLVYESMVTPVTVFDYDLDTRVLETLKVQEIPSGYDADEYVTERLLVPARDGVEVPVSLVRHRDVTLNGSAPACLYGYGAYGMSIEPGFSSSRLSLLERGFVYAIAHVRGGDDLGYHWYESGKLERRENTFNDFVDVARHLIDAGYTRAGRLAISGGSAGGELVAAAVNQSAELFGAVLAHVPFVDVLNTMLDPDLPLTPIEWPEWGNPIEDRKAFDLIRSYSPYDQLRPGAYPAMLVTAGINDPRVTYWEPAKYVAKLRHLKTDDNWLLLKTNMDAGHRGRSGRFEALRETAEDYAFLLVSLGLAGARAGHTPPRLASTSSQTARSAPSGSSSTPTGSPRIAVDRRSRS